MKKSHSSSTAGSTTAPKPRTRRRKPRSDSSTAMGSQRRKPDRNHHNVKKSAHGANRTSSQKNPPPADFHTIQENSVAEHDRNKALKALPVDPFTCSLRCNTSKRNNNVLSWHNPIPPVPLATEVSLIPSLITFGAKERGMFKEQPLRRLVKLERLCEGQRSQGVSLIVALSLRRHHIKRLNPFLDYGKLRLGAYPDVRQSAELFEIALCDFLRLHNVDFYDEKAQKTHIQKHRKPPAPYPPTPDFILKTPWRVQVASPGHSRSFNQSKTVAVHPNAASQNQAVLKEKVIHWIEAKMFYGASTIAFTDSSAVGNLLGTAQKYVAVHGPGAMVFSAGYGEGLAQRLDAVGVLCLDARDCGVDLSCMEAHQRTWCANRDGKILP